MKAIALTLASAALLTLSHAQDFIAPTEQYVVEDDGLIGDWDPNWNYAKGGDDWAFANCNNTKQQ